MTGITAIIIIAVAFIVLMLLGIPVSFAIGIPCICWLLMKPGMPVTVVAQNCMKHMLSFTLISLPGFLFVGRIMNSSGVTDRLFKFAVAMVGRFRGGLAHANALASMLFASMSGTAIGDAGGLGLVEMRMMKKAGYQEDVAAGITASSSILGPIIPPSSCMVLLGSIAEISVASLFYGGILPGILMGAALMINIGVRAHFTQKGRVWPKTRIPWREALKTVPQAIPALLTFVIILGSILGGICTATEAAILAAWYAVFLGACYKKLTWKSLWKTLSDTVEACGIFMLLISIASFLAWIFTIEGIPMILKSFMLTFASNPTILLLICAGVFLIIGCFLDTSAGVLLLAPILCPIVSSIGINEIQFGLVMTVGLMIGIITPPFGICLFVVSEVGGVPVRDTTKEAVKYLPAMVIVLLMMIFFPQLVTFLPETLLG